MYLKSLHLPKSGNSSAVLIVLSSIFCGLLLCDPIKYKTKKVCFIFSHFIYNKIAKKKSRKNRFFHNIMRFAFFKCIIWFSSLFFKCKKIWIQINSMWLLTCIRLVYCNVHVVRGIHANNELENWKEKKIIIFL